MLPHRALLIMLLAVGGSTLQADEPKPTDDAEKIQGVWKVVDLQQVGHESSDEEKAFFKSGGFRITITENKLIYSLDKSEGNYRLDTSRTPKVLEILVDDKVLAKAIYELKGDDLKICQGRQGEGGEPEPPDDFDVKKAKPGTFPTLFVLKRLANEPSRNE